MAKLIDAYELDFLEEFTGYEVNLFNIPSRKWCCLIRKRIKGEYRTICDEALVSLAEALERAENALKKEFSKADD